jgi:hypothetical protein
MTVELVTDLIRSIRERTNMEHSNFVTDDEIVRLMNRSNTELYDFLIQTFEDYVVTTYDFDIVSGQDSYLLPTDFYKIAGVDLYLDAFRKISLTKFNFTERNMYSTTTWAPVLTNSPLRYRILGEFIKFIPLPQQGHHVQLWYYPQAKTLTRVVSDPTTETDRLVSILPIFNDYIILDTSIQILQKEESDVSSYVREKQETIERIRISMGTRDTQPDSVTDVYNVNGTYGNIGIVR